MRTLTLITIGFIVAVAITMGCPKKQEAPPSQTIAPEPPTFAAVPFEMTVKQRTTTVVPHSDKALSLTIDDITRGQVMVSLARKDGGVVLAPTSLSEGKSAEFDMDGKSYFVLLESLDNELVGNDAATFVFSDSMPKDGRSPTESTLENDSTPSAKLEREKIERLIEHVGSLEGAVFIRNGEEHAPADAAAHLRRKWEAAGGEIATAEAFIDQLASKSSISGQPYVIRLKDGSEILAGEYLRERLAELKHAE